MQDEWYRKAPRLFKQYHPTWAKFVKQHVTEYTTVILSDRLASMINFLGDFTRDTNTEIGGFLIKTGVGLDPRSIGVRLVNITRGEGREIFLEPEERLEPGEQYLGTFHCHPVTTIPSIHDVLTFLSDPTEQLSIIRGVDGTINLVVKTDQTRALDPNMVDQLKDKYVKGDDGMAMLVRDFTFLFYQGYGNTVKRAYDMGTTTLDNPIGLDELAFGITGANQLPDTGSKKGPIKKGWDILSKDFRYIPDHKGRGHWVKR